MADPITFTVMLGVAVTLLVVDECYRAYKKRKIRKEVERQLGITPEDRREIRRLRRERERERRVQERERRRRLRQRQRAMADGTWVGDENGGQPDEFSEAAGSGLPEYSLRPRDGVDRAVTDQSQEGLTMNGQKRRGIRSIFKRRQSEPELIVEGELQRAQKKKKGWFRKKSRRVDEQPRASLVEGSPPPYEVIAGELEEEPAEATSDTPRRINPTC